jgi:hypothetical protein
MLKRGAQSKFGKFRSASYSVQYVRYSNFYRDHGRSTHMYTYVSYIRTSLFGSINSQPYEMPAVTITIFQDKLDCITARFKFVGFTFMNAGAKISLRSVLRKVGYMQATTFKSESSTLSVYYNPGLCFCRSFAQTRRIRNALCRPTLVINVLVSHYDSYE